MTRFEDLALHSAVLSGVKKAGFTECTPIQALALPHALDHKDLFCQAQTGTGKTAAFLLATFTHILHDKAQRETPARKGAPMAIVLAPTRELALQIVSDAEKLGAFTGLNIVAVYGGMGYRQQIRQLEKEVDLVVATPGRLIDFLRQNILDLKKTRIAIIDEADRMLDMGFIPDVRQILRHLPPPGSRQTLLFSATLSPTVKRLANQWTRDPLELTVNPEELTVDSIQQVNITVREQEKLPVLVDLLNHWKNPRVLVFTNRKISAELLCKKLSRSKVSAAFLSGDVSQQRRISILDGFKKGRLNVLVATDLASRGIHVDNISLVINYDIPYEPEAYVHRIGRTARSGKEGVAINFVCEVGGFYMADVENLLGQSIESLTHHELFDRLKDLLPAPAEKSEEIRPRAEKLDGERKKPVSAEHQPTPPSFQLESANSDLNAVRTQSHPPAPSKKLPNPPSKTKSPFSRRRKSIPPGGHDRAFNRSSLPERVDHSPAGSEKVQSPRKEDGARGTGSRRRRNHKRK